MTFLQVGTSRNAWEGAPESIPRPDVCSVTFQQTEECPENIYVSGSQLLSCSRPSRASRDLGEFKLCRQYTTETLCWAYAVTIVRAILLLLRLYHFLCQSSLVLLLLLLLLLLLWLLLVLLLLVHPRPQD